MSEETKENALVALATDPTAILGDGVNGNEPIFNVALMTELGNSELMKLQGLPNFDLTSENGRKALRAAVKPVKQTFADFEKNIKIVKKAFGDIPKKCDAVSKAMRDLSEPAIEKVLAPLEELTEQEKIVLKWWKKEGIPHTKYELENGLRQLVDMKPSPYSSDAEIADFNQHKAAYVAEWEKCLNRIYLEEQAQRDAEQKRREEDERLRKEREQLEAEAKKQREAQAAIEAEQRRLAQEQAELERQKQQAQQAAVNPPLNSTETKPTAGGGAPSALSEEAKREMRREAVEILAGFMMGQLVMNTPLKDPKDWARYVCEKIYKNEIPHVRFYYENN